MSPLLERTSGGRAKETKSKNEEKINRYKRILSILAILLVWLCACSPATQEEILRGLTEVLESVSESLDESPPAYEPTVYPYKPREPRGPRPWTRAELAAWEEYKAAAWEDVQSTIVGIRVTGGTGIELNPNLPSHPTEGQVIADYNRTLRVNLKYCSQNPEDRIPFLKRRAESHRRAAARNYEDMRRKGWIR